MLYKIILALILSVSVASAQPIDPLAQPRWDGSGITFAGTFNVPDEDANGVSIKYGGNGAAVSEDGRFLYASCWGKVNTSPANNGRGMYVKLEIPPLGQMARIVENCKGLTLPELGKVHPDPTAYHPSSAGIVEINGRLVVSGYITYDANGQTNRSHWSGTSLTTLAGPFSGTVSPGLVKGQMGIVPPEWRPLLGGDVYATAGYTSIINRASYAPAFTVFNSASVTQDGFQMRMLQGCPHSVPKCITWGTPQNIAVYNGSEQSGGSFFISGTRTLAVVEREALGPTCYGYATRNQAEHGQPYLDAVKCYSLSDALDQKGPMGYPYQLVIKLYDATGFVDVVRGLKQPWDNVTPYAVIPMPGNGAGDSIGYYGGGAYNPKAGHYYLLRELHGQIRVYTGFPPANSTPVATNCVPGVESMVSETPGVCVNGTKTFTQVWQRTGDVLETNGGTACAPVVTPRFRTEPCVVDPPPPPPVNLTVFTAVKTCRVTIQSQPPDQLGGWGVQFRWDQNNFGSKDTSAPFERARDFPAGTYQLGAIWTKTGQTPVYVPMQTYECK